MFFKIPTVFFSEIFSRVPPIVLWDIPANISFFLIAPAVPSKNFPWILWEIPTRIILDFSLDISEVHPENQQKNSQGTFEEMQRRNRLIMPNKTFGDFQQKIFIIFWIAWANIPVLYNNEELLERPQKKFHGNIAR